MRRLFPPAPTIVREAARDTDIGGYAVRKGQWLGCAVYSMHRNPKYWQARRPRWCCIIYFHVGL